MHQRQVLMQWLDLDTAKPQHSRDTNELFIVQSRTCMPGDTTGRREGGGQGHLTGRWERIAAPSALESSTHPDIRGLTQQAASRCCCRAMGGRWRGRWTRTWRRSAAWPPWCAAWRTRTPASCAAPDPPPPCGPARQRPPAAAPSAAAVVSMAAETQQLAGAISCQHCRSIASFRSSREQSRGDTKL